MRKRSSYQSRHDVRWLVAGLGNPGPKYAGTPHNVGFEVIELLSARHRVPMIAKFEGMFGVGSIEGVDTALLMPLTYMNLSGQSVRPAQRSVGLEPSQVVIVHDDADLPFGTVRVKQGGGLAGHNGLRSVAQVLGTNEFVRVRMGVGRPGPEDRRPMAQWILAPFDPVADTATLYQDAAAAVERIVRDGVTAAMNATNASR